MEEDNDKGALPKAPPYVPPAERGKKGKEGENALALGVGVGVALGTAFGVALGNIGLGIALGIAIGAGLGTAFQAKAKQKKGEEG
ncbi:hypothetical protein [Kordiimonas gwangyangensis]|uniref:hypothetical protein n=1 Tax=Kordiimonas gwangyangensis TaxID=288022 RepID=UPI00036665EA|nr:hypothetical protein [Kordiimonas gwangyangensis]